MSENFNQLINYLNSENLKIDKSEFNYQFESHPDSPSLLALSDTLTFFKIKNGAFKVGFENLSKLPDKFIAGLKNKSETSLFFITRNGENFTYQNQRGTIKYVKSKNELKEIWEDVVLLIDSSTIPTIETPPKHKIIKITVSLALILFASIILLSDFNMRFNFFYLIPLIGLVFSFAAFKDLFTSKTGLIDKFCGLTGTSGCESVINSSKWKIFEFINFSDLSLIFFATQFIGYFWFDQLNLIEDYFVIQKYLLALSFPFIFLSLYFQKYTEKKWCPICISISVIIALESFVVLLYFNYSVKIDWYSISLYFLISLIITSFWLYLESNLKNLKKLKDFEIKSNRFKRTYSVFKNSLFSGANYNLPDNIIVLGDASALLSFTFVTSPFCGHCLEPYNLLKDLLAKYEGEISVSIVYNVHENNEMLKSFAENIMQGYLEFGDRHYFEAMDYWYKVNDLTKWLEKYGYNQKSSKVDSTLKIQRAWLTKMNFNFTPILFLNNFKFPEAYDITDLNFLLEEILYDFKKNEKHISDRKVTI